MVFEVAGELFDAHAINSRCPFIAHHLTPISGSSGLMCSMASVVMVKV